MSFEECLQAAAGVLNVIPTDGIEYEDAYVFCADTEQFTSGSRAVAVMKNDGSVRVVSEYETGNKLQKGRSFMTEYRGGHYTQLEEKEIPRPEWGRPRA